MTLALLELTVTPHGDVLEQLAVITIDEAAAWRHRVSSDAVSHVRLFARMDSELPGVPLGIRAQLECAALSSLDQLARTHLGAAGMPGPLRALWRGGLLEELANDMLADSFAEWLEQPGPIDDCVMLELGIPTSTGSNSKPYLAAFYARLRDDLANHMRHRAGPTQERHREVVASDGRFRKSIDALAPAEQILVEAAQLRQALAEQWPSAALVGARLGEPSGSGEELASRLRREGKLLGVYIASPTSSYRYPAWQFGLDGQPVDHLADILAVLRDSGCFQREPGGLRRTTGWGEVEWFLSPHILLDGAPPAEALATDPARVLFVAHVEFEAGA